MASPHTVARAAHATAARKKKRMEEPLELEQEEQDTVTQYLMGKKHEEPFDQCLWFSRGMHHVRFPGTQLHTAVQDAQRDEYIAVQGHGGKWQRVLHRARRLLNSTKRVEMTAAKMPHVHLCIVEGGDGAQKRFETKKLADVLTWCDEQALAAYVECCQVADLALYTSKGFTVVQTVDEVEADCARLYALWRTPVRRRRLGLAND
ncbi:hypothetical protein FGB62_156g09 [Gracilaria domingensis]|nr:hypothetical protein FGB62_156g09 [Gracilaria domingensis]